MNSSFRNINPFFIMLSLIFDLVSIDMQYAIYIKILFRYLNILAHYFVPIYNNYDDVLPLRFSFFISHNSTIIVHTRQTRTVRQCSIIGTICYKKSVEAKMHSMTPVSVWINKLFCATISITRCSLMKVFLLLQLKCLSMLNILYVAAG